ncbi:Hypothetical protein PHPALM_1257 [Phytophthora palmivora]|uniref:Uncharacterized protein n=1 Tax=Phytophthora palmivora TaxID=4796 RepID=A0A2P4YSQ8_9STRA|nr:Hypothetical protein PHPALM_1257 [Phytophthora palmivora]
MKITKRHLNEEKLAIVNRLLQKQLTLLPLSAKLQNLVLQLSNYQLKEPLRAPTWPEGNRSSNEVVQDLLTCIAVNENAVSADYNNFLHYLPVELVTKTPLSSVVGAQRLVFFRYFIDIIATERMKVQSNSSKSPPALSDEPPAKRKSQSGKRRKSSKRTSVGVVATPQGDVKVVTSILAAHGSLPITSEAGGANNETSPENELFEPPDHVGDECEKPVSQLQLQLELAINQFRQTLPSFDSDTLNPETRATYLAAMACHQSVLLMLENNIDVDSAMSDKLKHFIEALQAIQIKTSAKEIPAELLGAETEDNQLLDPPRFPPPYPESEEGDEERESGSVKTDFPPPYAITTPSYWTFNPSIPEPQSSIAKLASKSPNCKSAELRSRFMPKESPVRK